MSYFLHNYYGFIVEYECLSHPPFEPILNCVVNINVKNNDHENICY